MINRCNLAIITIMLTIGIVGPALADTVEITGGQIIQGKLISVDGNVAKIKSNKQNMAVPRESIIRIIFDNNTGAVPQPAVKTADPVKPIENNNVSSMPPIYTTQPQPEYTPPEVEPVAPEQNNLVAPDITTPVLPNMSSSLPPSMAEVNEENGIVSDPVPPVISQPQLKPGLSISDHDTSDVPLPTENNIVSSANYAPENTVDYNAFTTENHGAAIIPDNTTSSFAPESVATDNSATANFGETANSISSARNQLLMDYITYIEGNSSNRKYYGIYSNDDKDQNLTIHLSESKVNKLSFKLYAQKNGKVPPLYTSSSIIFFDDKGKVISKTNPVIVESEKFVEWFKNLDNIAGITGAQNVEINVPQNAASIKIIGFRPGSKNNLVGYVSDIRLDNSPVENLNKL